MLSLLGACAKEFLGIIEDALTVGVLVSEIIKLRNALFYVWLRNNTETYYN
jgi:hypothetical protein